MKKQIGITLLFFILLSTIVYCTAPTVTHYGQQIFSDGVMVKNSSLTVTDANSVAKFSVDPNGSITAAADTDTTFTFGRGKIGYNSIASDIFCVSHYDCFSNSDYALKQNNLGDTYVNGKYARTIYFNINDNNIATISSTGLTMASGKTITIDGLTIQAKAGSLADDATIALPSGISGWGEIQCGDDEEWCTVKFKADGTITLRENSLNISTSDTDGRFCIYSNAGVITIKNRLGSSKNVAYKFEYRIIP